MSSLKDSLNNVCWERASKRLTPTLSYVLLGRTEVGKKGETLQEFHQFTIPLTPPPKFLRACTSIGLCPNFQGYDVAALQPLGGLELAGVGHCTIRSVRCIVLVLRDGVDC
jgi:hypothetical protein